MSLTKTIILTVVDQKVDIMRHSIDLKNSIINSSSFQRHFRIPQMLRSPEPYWDVSYEISEKMYNIFLLYDGRISHVSQDQFKGSSMNIQRVSLHNYTINNTTSFWTGHKELSQYFDLHFHFTKFSITNYTPVNKYKVGRWSTVQHLIGCSGINKKKWKEVEFKKLIC